MPRAYSGDMRQRLIAEVESGASRRAAAEEFAVSASTAIIWVKCFRETGRCAAKSRGGSISPLEEHADFLLSRPRSDLDDLVGLPSPSIDVAGYVPAPTDERSLDAAMAARLIASRGAPGAPAGGVVGLL